MMMQIDSRQVNMTYRQAQIKEPLFGKILGLGNKDRERESNKQIQKKKKQIRWC